ncbi:MAG: hypothetical protein JST19_05875 [Bacteroidetes bacterium]|nr:hypothetical protein [Bacteroidota bacterium]
MKNYASIFRNWFSYAAMITLICGIVYVTVQQSYRMSANDPQFQVAEDTALALDKGADPKTLTGANSQVEISRSLALWLIIYDMQGNVAASSARLDGAAPQFPKGVLNHTRSKGADAVTWQPRPGIRQATVTVGAKDYTVVTGRSLRLTEERISLLGSQVLFGWVLSVLAMLVIAFLQEMVVQKPTN